MIHSQNTKNTLPFTTMDLIEIQHFLFQRRHKKLDFPIKMKGIPFHYSGGGFYQIMSLSLHTEQALKTVVGN